MKTVEAQIKLSAKDESGTVLTAFSKRMQAISQLTQKLGAHNAGFGAMRERLGEVGSAFGELSEKMAGALEGLTALAGVTVGLGFASLTESVKKSAEGIKELGENAKAIGVNVGALQDFSIAAEMAGVSASAVPEALKHGAENFASFEAGIGRIRGQIQKLDPSLFGALASKAHTAGQSFNLVLSEMNRLQQSGQGAQALKLSELFFGTNDFTKITQDADRFNKFMADAGQSHDKLTSKNIEDAANFVEAGQRIQNSLSGIGEAITNKISGPLGDMMNSLSTFMNQHRDLIAGKIGQAILGVGDSLAKFDWKGFGQELLSVGAGFKAVFDAVGPKWMLIGVLTVPFMGFAASVISLAAALAKLGVTMYTVGLPVTIAFAALGLAAYEVYHRWDDLSKWFSEFSGKTLPQALLHIAEGIKNAIPIIQQDMDDLAAALFPAWLNYPTNKLADKLGAGSIYRFLHPADPNKAAGGSQSNPGFIGGSWLPGRLPSVVAPGHVSYRARGGPVSTGSFSIVGEKGPELVQWGANGGVLSNENSMGFLSFARWAMGALPSSLMGLVQVLSDLRDYLLGNAPASGAGAGGGSRASDYGAGLPVSPGGAYANVTTLPDAGKLGNAGAVYKMMTGLGIPRVAAIGAVASLMGESGKSLSTNPPGWNDGGTSGGMMQAHGERFAALKGYAASMHKPWTDPTAQIGYIQYELQHRYANVLNALRSAHSAQEATAIWTRFYESPRVDNTGARLANIPYATRAANVADQQAAVPAKAQVHLRISAEPGTRVHGVTNESTGRVHTSVALDLTGRTRFNRGMM